MWRGWKEERETPCEKKQLIQRNNGNTKTFQTLSGGSKKCRPGTTGVKLSSRRN